MATEIFKKDLEALDRIVKRLSEMNAKLKGINKPMQDFQKTTNAISKQTEKMTRSFSKLYSIIKGIGLTGVFGGAGLAVRGIMAQKSVTESRVLGVTTREKGALEFAGKQGMADPNFFKNVLKSIKDASVSQEGYDLFAILGLDAQKIRQMKSLDALNKTLDALSKFDKRGREDLFQDIVSGITGLSSFQFEALDLNRFKKDFQEGLRYFDNSNDKLKVIGESVNRVTANFQLLTDKILASLAPAFSRVLDNVTKGINAIATNQAFQNVLNSISNWAVNISKGFDSKVESIIKSIPDTIREIQLIFLKILSAFASASRWVLFGENDRRAKNVAEWAESQISDIERQQLIGKVQDSGGKPVNMSSMWDRIDQIDLQQMNRLKTSGGESNMSSMWDRINKIDNGRGTKEEISKIQPQINITINNDPTQAQVQKNFTTSIMLGGSNGGFR